MCRLRNAALGRVGRESAFSRALVRGAQSIWAPVLSPPPPPPALGPFHLLQPHTAHCSGTKAIEISEKEGEKINSVELILLVSEQLALAPEWGVTQGGWRPGGPGHSLAGREQRLSCGFPQDASERSPFGTSPVWAQEPSSPAGCLGTAPSPPPLP